MARQIFIQMIGDYGSGDPAFAEIIQKLKSISPKAEINPVPVPKFSTVATGVWIAQLAIVNPFPGLVIYSNTAPRKKSGEDTTRTFRGQFGQLAYTKLKNGIPVIAVHYGYAFSFLKRHMTSLRLVNVSNTGTQFRSRDNYPDAVVGLVNGDTKYIGDPIPLDSIPSEPRDLIGFIDGYGNLKTTNRASKLKWKTGDKVKITLNGVSHIATVADQVYYVSDGELVYAPGSTGGDDRFLEIWVRNGSAYDVFDKPHVESKFEVLKIT